MQFAVSWCLPSFIVSNCPDGRFNILHSLTNSPHFRHLYLQGVSTANEVYQVLNHRGWQELFPLFSTVHEICAGLLPPTAIVEQCERTPNFSLVEGSAEYYWSFSTRVIPLCYHARYSQLRSSKSYAKDNIYVPFRSQPFKLFYHNPILDLNVLSCFNKFPSYGCASHIC